MAAIPESPHKTSTAIVRWYESKPQQHRPHMGASIIGHACDRHIWLTWRWAFKPSFPGRILRLFSSGVREEPRFLEELRGIGAEVWELDPSTGRQWRVSAHNGHFAGSLDGVAKGLPEAPKTPAVLEFKTHSHKSFTDLVAKGVRESKPQHFDQMTVYMGLMDLDRALYMGCDKDTDDVYTEWVHFDKDRFEFLMGKAERLINSTEPPQRISDDPTHWTCKMCSFYKHCHAGLAAEANCRTCCHASPVADAAWQCEAHMEHLTEQQQREGCEDHLMIPALVPYAEAIDGGTSWVAYRHRDSGATFVNGAGLEDTTYGPCFSSHELHVCPESLLPLVAEVKEQVSTARVVSGTAFDDMASDNLDEVPTKREHPAQRESRKKIAASLRQLEQMQP